MSDEHVFEVGPLKGFAHRVAFDGGYVEPLGDYAERVSALDALAVPLSSVGAKTWLVHPSFLPQSDWGPRGQTRQFRYARTHRLAIIGGATPQSAEPSVRLITGALGVICGQAPAYGHRWHDVRLPWEASNRYFASGPDVAAVCSACVRTAHTPNSGSAAAHRRAITRLVGALWLHGRIVSYIWPWERLNWEYVVFDSLFKTLRDAGRLGDSKRRITHTDRIQVAIDELKYTASKEYRAYIPEIVSCRNNLVHECVEAMGNAAHEGEGELGTGGTAVAQAWWMLRCLNERLVFDALGVDMGQSSATLGAVGGWMFQRQDRLRRRSTDPRDPSAPLMTDQMIATSREEFQPMFAGGRETPQTLPET